ncbi:brain-derived neurotrophic factor-like [Anneissia japonica]|uniref:brain-derived neurotrophic factor-like n=1 Tax=Anneissia japonica TaxID=1529436 RepID=UPI0014257E65|nr:brain-derived neurotrophic factor-like [Anneissia japonica]XP_033101632.1 brain-derived neurotrophic factor-like [Anneissia japonica]XP_033101633.1 brain-derived neurotrophic factor-like [Anneissia japonica]XP_033101634.1 brain-derived neurotrophic factor-like [Anneissia japonica]
MEFRTRAVTGFLTLELLLVGPLFISNCLAFPSKFADSDIHEMDHSQKPVSQFTNHQRQGKGNEHMETVSHLVYDLNEINKMSERTFFSESTPDRPPKAFLTVDKNSDFSGNSSVHSRKRRSSNEILSVCDQSTSWTRKKWAMSFYGENVTVVERIKTFDKSHTAQFFYETSCSKKGSNKNGCRGIDAAFYSSECITKESYVYAIVRNKQGQEGWNWIAINSSCDCALRLMPKSHRVRHHRSRCRRPLVHP